MHVFVEIALILAVATVISFLMRVLRQSLVVGYILSGIIVGPFMLGIVSTTEYIDLFSKFGIAILLFVVGLSLKTDVVREVGKTSLITGIGQVFFTSFFGFFIMRLLGFEIVASLYGAVALTFSSTIIILKLLSDKSDLGKLYGKISVGILLVQDILAIIILLVVSFFASSLERSPEMIFFSFTIVLAFFVALYLISRFILPSLSTFLAKSQEALFLFSITWGLGIAAIFWYFGFSLEIGALIAGVSLSASPYSQEISSRMKPLRDFFILLFFVLLGSQIVVTSIAGIIVPTIILSLFILVGNPIIVFVIMNLLGYKSRTGFLTGLTVAQISEFSLILIALGFSLGHLTQEVVSLVTLVGIITIAGSTYLIMYADKIYPHLKPFLKILEFRKNGEVGKENDDKAFDMIIFGYDRVGYEFVKTAEKINTKHLVVDFNPQSIKKLKELGIPYRFGDADNVNFLEEIELTKAEIVVSTIPDFKTNLNLVSYYHSRKPKGIIIVVSHDAKDAKALYEKGASFVIIPHYLGATYATRMIETHGVKARAFEQEKEKHLEYLEKREEGLI